MLTTKIICHEGQMEFGMNFERGCLRALRLAQGHQAWISGDDNPGLFTFEVDGNRLSAKDMTLASVDDNASSAGLRQLVLHFQSDKVALDYHIHSYKDYSVLEFFPLIKNISQQPVLISRVDTVSMRLDEGEKECLAFTGNWGSEFEPIYPDLSRDVILESRSGRSSKGNHPWISLTRPDGSNLSASVAWSGNWVIRMERDNDGKQRLSGGLHDWEFSKWLKPGEQMKAPAVVLATGESLNVVSQMFSQVGRKFWYPKNPFPERLPVEWNHWWPYEDAEINEQVFLENVEKASEMGFDICTLDAGWFGPAEKGTFWEHFRGDWDLVNTSRFPRGIRFLADAVHQHGMRFGIWCEIEAVGEKAQIARNHPEYLAMRDGKPLGCVCFGNPAVQEWAFQTVSRLVNDYRADWIKFDFNLDPGAGCNREDHGHQAGDGLYEHYTGYYRFLNRVRGAFPALILENCSSGGLRIDPAMMRHVHCTYLSDPDWPIHDLQIFWGASCLFPPNLLLHWTYSYWRNLNPPPYQTFDPYDPTLTEKKWNYLSHISMLGMYGISQKLPLLPAWMADRVVKNNQVYKDIVQEFVLNGDLYRLTSQPLRSGKGDRWAAFQYSLPEPDRHLLFVFRLPGSEITRAITLQNLSPDCEYIVRDVVADRESRVIGSTLMTEGLLFKDLAEEESALYVILTSN